MTTQSTNDLDTAQLTNAMDEMKNLLYTYSVAKNASDDENKTLGDFSENHLSLEILMCLGYVIDEYGLDAAYTAVIANGAAGVIDLVNRV